MEVTEFGMVTEVKPVQPKNADTPMPVTEFGMVTEVKPVQPENADPPMLVTEFGITVVLQPETKVLVSVSIMALQLPRLSYFGLPKATTMEVKPVQP